MRCLEIGATILLALAAGHGRTGAAFPGARGRPPGGAAAAARDKPVLARLDTRVTLHHPRGAPLKQVVAEIARATRGPNDAGLPVYIDPVGLQIVERTPDSPVTIDAADARVKDVLTRVLAPLGLAYRVFDGVVVISAPDWIKETFSTVPPAARDATPATRAVLARLERPVPMHYPQLTPIGRVLKDIKKATAGPGDPGLPVHVSPKGLRDAEKTMDSPVSIDLEGVPLRTTLRLVLRQLGMDYHVKDGMVRITNPSSEEFAPD